MSKVSCSRMMIVLLGVFVCVLSRCNDATADFVFGTPTRVPNVNSSSGDALPDISADGLELYFSSDRPGGDGSDDIWVAKRATKGAPWSTPVNLGPPVNSSASEVCPDVSADRLELFFSDGLADPYTGWTNRPGGHGGGDLWVATRATANDPWAEPVNLGPNVNSTYYDWFPNISADGLLLFFSSGLVGSVGGYGWADIWVTERATTAAPWGEPVNLGPLVNTSIEENGPTLLSDGSTLYFSRGEYGAGATWDLWQSEITPKVDLNGDGIVDAADVCFMIDHWGRDEPLCDIGSMPWGDGIVDVQDLIVLAEHLFEEIPSPGQAL